MRRGRRRGRPTKKARIEAAWETRDSLRPDVGGVGGTAEAVNAALGLLDRGELRVAEKTADGCANGIVFSTRTSRPGCSGLGNA